MADNLLSLMTFFPLLGMLLVLFIPRENGALLKSTTLVVTLITFVLSLPLAFDDVFTVSGGMHYREFHEWINIGNYFQMNYNLGVDGISLWLIMLTTFIMPIAVLSTWNAGTDTFEHFGWGVTPELAMRVGRRAGDFELEAAARLTFLDDLVAEGVTDVSAVRAALSRYRAMAAALRIR